MQGASVFRQDKLALVCQMSISAPKHAVIFKVYQSVRMSGHANNPGYLASIQMPLAYSVIFHR
jgi:hypothetical protein